MSSKPKVSLMTSPTKRVPKAVLGRLSRLLADAQAAQAMAQKAALTFNESVATALESLGYEPDRWAINIQTGEIQPNPQKDAPADAPN